MSFGEIEFLDEPEPASPPAPGAAPETGGPRRAAAPLPAVAAAVGWLAVAVLAVWAPFRMLYSVTITSDGPDTLRQSLDGWGRIAVHSSSGSADPSDIGHAARYGVALSVCAGLAVLAAGAVVLLLAGRSGPPWSGRTPLVRRATAATGIAIPCLLAGVIAAVALAAQAQADSLRGGLPQNISIQFALGGCLWLSLAALGCAVFGSAAYLAGYLRRPARRVRVEIAEDGLPILHTTDGTAPMTSDDVRQLIEDDRQWPRR